MNRCLPSSCLFATLILVGGVNLRADAFPSTMFALSPAREGSLCAEGGLVEADDDDASRGLGIHAGWFLPGKDGTQAAEEKNLALGSYRATARYTGFQVGAMRTLGDYFGIAGCEWIDHKVSTLDIVWATTSYGPYIAGQKGTRQEGGFGVYSRIGRRFGSVGLQAGYGTVSRWMGGLSYHF